MTETRFLHKVLGSVRQMKESWTRRSPAGLYMTVIAVDIQGFGDPKRSQQHREVMVEGLRAALRKAFDRALKEIGKGWADCTHEDEGDGMLVLIPEDIPCNLMVMYLPSYLSTELRKYNETRCPEAQIQLRESIHVGPVPAVVTSHAVILAKRLVETAALRTALENDSSKVLGLIASDKFYRETIRQDSACNPQYYAEVPVHVKEIKSTGWMYLL